jgi:glycosyltransferase involved in cell wall biosynthesis
VKNNGLARDEMRAAARPLVSVGIPTFNRPEGLRRTLNLICHQTYSNLEILISDNASPGPETEQVAREFAARDERIRYFRQPTNVGPTGNFRFVLAESSGEYFMWAPDDDEWDASFIETCLAAANPRCSVMTNFTTLFRESNTRQDSSVPELSPDSSLAQNVKRFFANMQPSLFYGLHPRTSVLFFLEGPSFDFYDCHVVLRIIIESGFRTLKENIYTAGVDAPSYQVKYADATQKRLRFGRFLWYSLIVVARSPQLSMLDKLDLSRELFQLVRRLRNHHSGRTR